MPVDYAVYSCMRLALTTTGVNSGSIFSALLEHLKTTIHLRLLIRLVTQSLPVEMLIYARMKYYCNINYNLMEIATC